MFGSGLTLASFMKLTHAVFLGVPSRLVEQSKTKEVGFSMLFPMIVLALICIIFGVFSSSIPVGSMISPAVPGLSYIGFWSPGFATIMIIVGLITGLIIYIAGNIKGVREVESFVGGEEISAENRLTGTGFYNTIINLSLLKMVYEWSEAKWFDIYDRGVKFSYCFANVLRKMHTGLLNIYLMWVFLGLMILLIVLMGGS